MPTPTAYEPPRFDAGHQRPHVMGILNVTPDSFSDGGRHADADAALRRAQEMILEGADILDVGGESTRPGSEPVPLDLEWSRLDPILDQVIDMGTPYRSIPTRRRSRVAPAQQGRSSSMMCGVCKRIQPWLRLLPRRRACSYDA